MRGLVALWNCGDGLVQAVYECSQYQQVDLALTQAETKVNIPVFINTHRLVAFGNCGYGMSMQFMNAPNIKRVGW